MSLADLIQLDGSSALMAGWAAQVRAQWAARRAAASVSGSDGGAWLDGDAARGVACDASLTPVVTGEVDLAALDELVRLCVQLDKLRHGGHGSTSGDGGATARRRDGDGGGTVPDPAAAPRRPRRPRAAAEPGRPGPDAARAREALEQAIIGKAVGLLSGPGGLAGSFAAGSSAPGSAAPACPWTSGCPAASRPRSAGR